MTFLDLMDAWRLEFNEKYASRGCEMYWSDFTPQYKCMKVKRDPEELLEDHVCIGHLHEEKSPRGMGVEFEGEMLRPEDPEFFAKLTARVEKKLRG